MRHIEMYLPFGLAQTDQPLPSPESWHLPALAKLLARGKVTEPILPSCAPLDAMPLERFCIQHMPPAFSVAHAIMQQVSKTQPSDSALLLHPVYLQVTLDKLLLGDPFGLPLNAQESRALFEAARESFEDRQLTLHWLDTHTWLLEGNCWNHLPMATPRMASGRHIASWLSSGEDALKWQVIHNEIQMRWHQHPVNQARTEQGLPPVNALWLWGTPLSREAPLLSSEQTMLATHLFLEKNSFASYEAWQSSPAASAVLVEHSLTAPALEQRWDLWMEAYHHLEKNWFAPLLAALAQGKLARITLHADNETTMRSCMITRGALRRFWLRPSLQRWFT